MIVKTNTGYQVKSERGVNLSLPDLTLEEAEERLKQVEMFKHMKAAEYKKKKKKSHI